MGHGRKKSWSSCRDMVFAQSVNQRNIVLQDRNLFLTDKHVENVVDFLFRFEKGRMKTTETNSPKIKLKGRCHPSEESKDTKYAKLYNTLYAY